MVLFHFVNVLKNQCQNQIIYFTNSNYAANIQFCIVYDNNIDQVALFQLNIVSLVIKLRLTGEHVKFHQNKT